MAEEGKIVCSTCGGSFKHTQMHVWLTGKNVWTWRCTTCQSCGDADCERCKQATTAA